MSTVRSAERIAGRDVAQAPDDVDVAGEDVVDVGADGLFDVADGDRRRPSICGGMRSGTWAVRSSP